MAKPLQLIQEFHTNLLSSKLEMIQLRSEEKKNGKTGLKTSTTGVTVKQPLPTPESLINLLSSKPEMTQLRLEEKKNGRPGLKILTTGVMVKPLLLTPEFHTNQHLNLKMMRMIWKK